MAKAVRQMQLVTTYNSIYFFLFRTAFRSVVTQRLLLGKTVICLVGITKSTQNEIYDEITSTSSFRFSHVS